MSNADPTLLSARLCSVCSVESHRGNRRYELTPVVVLEPSDELMHMIVGVCNEPVNYAALFQRVLDGRPYAVADAERFIAWGSQGWEEGTHFVYLLLDEERKVAGAIDIKSPSIESAEIGYWLAESHSGVMTNTVELVATLARDAGFLALHALVRPENVRSERVLLRAAFTHAGQTERGGTLFNRFERPL